MRRTTTRSPSGRNFIGILFLKGLNFLGFVQVAALASDECQRRARYVRRPGTPVKARRGQKGKKGGPGQSVPDEPLVSFKVFSGYFGWNRNRLPPLTLFMCGSAKASQNQRHGLRGP